jgi:hypothetical protein
MPQIEQSDKCSMRNEQISANIEHSCINAEIFRNAIMDLQFVQIGSLAQSEILQRQCVTPGYFTLL